MSFGELLSALLGWLGQFVEFVFSFVPRVKVVPFNKRGVRYVRDREPTLIEPGITWWWPWCTTIFEHYVSRCVLKVPPIAVETEDGVPVAIGAVVTYHLTDVVTYDAANFDSEENMAEVAGGALRDAVASLKWAQLCAESGDGSRLGKMLVRRMEKPLGEFGITVESCRPNDLVRIRHVVQLFGARAENAGIDKA